MLTNLHRWFNKRNWRRSFLVHFMASGDFKLTEFIENLHKSYALSVIKGAGTNFQSIEIRIRPKQLHEVIRKLPEEKVVVAYELKEPSKR